jgi:hypothetical protein
LVSDILRINTRISAATTGRPMRRRLFHLQNQRIWIAVQGVSELRPHCFWRGTGPSAKTCKAQLKTDTKTCIHAAGASRYGGADGNGETDDHQGRWTA